MKKAEGRRQRAEGSIHTKSGLTTPFLKLTAEAQRSQREEEEIKEVTQADLISDGNSTSPEYNLLKQNDTDIT